MTTTNVTPAEVNAALINEVGAKWPGNIAYSIPGAGASWQAGYGAGEPVSALYGTLSTDQANAFRVAIELWDSYIAPQMTEVADTPNAGIRVAFTDAGTIFGNPMVNAYAYNPQQGVLQDIDGDIWIDARFKDISFAQGTSIFQTMLHELGHTLGLKHSFANPVIPAAYEFTAYTVMSYTPLDYVYVWSNDDGLSSSSTGVDNATPMVLDILAIQSHYGADTATGAGNTTYTFDSFDARRAIYDASGNDTIDVSNFSRASHVDLRAGAYSDIGYFAIADQIEALVTQFGEDSRDFITLNMTDPNATAYAWTKNLGIAFSTTIENAIGGEASDEFIGNAVANKLYGRGGADTMSGDNGNDVLFGGLGADQLNGDAGIDYARYDDAAYGNLTISLANPSQNTGAAAGDTFNGIEGLWAGAGADVLKGDGGANILVGVGGSDALYGGAGADQLSGGDGIDYARYDDANYGALKISLANPAQNTGAAAGDVFASIEGIISGVGADLVGGNDGINYLYGGGGNDTVIGNGGNDVLYGGSGQDVFSFAKAPDTATNMDRIMDFNVADDTIQLQKAAFTKLFLSGPLKAALFHEGTAAHDADDRIVYDRPAGRLFYDEDGTGAVAAKQFATVTAGLALTNLDFVVA